MTKPVLGILGAGKLGTTLARLALKAGYTVNIAGSGAARKIALTTSIITPGAIALERDELIKESDVIILAFPLKNFETLPADLLAGKLVNDSMNYWREVDGDDPRFATGISTSELVQAHLPASTVVKALSHMGYHHLFDEAHNRTDRKAIAIAGNDDATHKVSQIIDDLGFDPLPIGPLQNGRLLEPGHPAFGANVNKQELLKILAVK